MIRHMIRSVVLGAAVFALSACEDNLTVQNPNAGDTKRVLGTPLDAENLLGSYYKRWSSGVFGSTTNLEGMADIYGMMSFSSLANSCMNSHYPFLGTTNFNSPGNTCQGEQFRLYSIQGEVNRVASSFLKAMDGGLTLGSPARDNRDRAFAELLRGLSLGYAALMHDSAGIVAAGTGAQDAGDLHGYKEVRDSALVAFQRAIDAANGSTAGAGGFPLPATWIPSPTSFTQAEFIKFVRSYRARIAANMARTPAERALVGGIVDWPTVIADAAAGFSVNHEVTTSTTVGPGNSWRSQYETFRSWHQMPPMIIGMADVSGSYATYIATPITDRGQGNNAFFMVTPDLRFPQGATRAAQQADFPITSCQSASQVCKRYFANRIGNDEFSGPGWGWSNYDMVRFHSWATSGAGTSRNGPLLFFAKAELELLRAEGLYRQGNFAAAGAIVNVTRVLNGLPAITVFDATTAVPGGANCVPKVPVAPFNVVACGNLWEALKYEKRIETAMTSYTPWYLDGRGWGDLSVNTPLYWATPFQELQARSRPTSAIYGAGIGAGNAPGSFSGVSTYGW